MEESDLRNSEVYYGEKSVSEIKTSIKDLEKKLDEIQKNCEHKGHSIKNVPTQSKNFCLRRICNSCEADLGPPTQEEIDNWVKN